MNKYLQIAHKVCDIESHYVQSLKSLFDDNFPKAVTAILNNNGRVIVCGIGKSGIVAKKFASTFSSIGKASFFLNAGEAIHGDLGMIQSDDIVVIISNSGESVELSEVINYCKNRKILIIAVLSNINSTLGQSADIPLLIPKDCEVTHLKIPTTSTTLMSVVGDAIAASIVEGKNVEVTEYKDYHPGGSIGNSMVKVSEVMRSGEDLPKVNMNDKMSEALIKMTQKSMGCLVVVDNKDKLVGIVTDGDLRRHLSQLLKSKVSDVMTPSPKSIEKEMFAIDALRYMNNNNITNLVVTLRSKAIGVVHLHDCIQMGLNVLES